MRRLRRAQRPRPPSRAGRAPAGARPGMPDRPRARARPGPGRGHLDRLGHRLHRRLLLAARRRLRRSRPAGAPARGVGGAGRLLPGPALAVPARVELHLGGLARRQVPRRPHPDPAGLPRLREGIAVNRPTHTRLRPFSTRDTYPEQNLDNDLCQAVVANGVVYLRGQVGQDLDTGESVGIGDAGAQAERAMANIELLLGEAGSRLADIVKVVVYLTDIRYREPVYRVMGQWLKGVHPVSTGLVVQALARPEWLGGVGATAGNSEPASGRS